MNLRKRYKNPVFSQRSRAGLANFRAYGATRKCGSHEEIVSMRGSLDRATLFSRGTSKNAHLYAAMRHTEKEAVRREVLANGDCQRRKQRKPFRPPLLFRPATSCHRPRLAIPLSYYAWADLALAPDFFFFAPSSVSGTVAASKLMLPASSVSFMSVSFSSSRVFLRSSAASSSPRISA